ncbi:MAG: 2-polyprenyl-3-methyl-6-methoxy-1,4-benzoquinone monooxygenase [Burkholderiaceae bacterium]
MTTIDALLNAADSALRTLWAKPQARRPLPQAAGFSTCPDSGLTKEQKKLSGALMRVNHVGEVCAQALYTAQALSSTNPALRAHYLQACEEETEHLAWTQERLTQLGDRTSLLNPLWYAGAFSLGLVAGRLNRGLSLGFVVETERQVEAHLESHLERLPLADQASRAIVAQMKSDEALHARQAQSAGAQELPAPIKQLMRCGAKLMTTVAHRI